MNHPNRVWALIPIKAFGVAKSRLRGVLTDDERAMLALQMARDVILTIRQSDSVDGVTLLGGDEQVARLARARGCDYLEEYYDAGLSANLNIAARQLASEGVGTLLVIPGDLPLLRPADIDELLARAAAGLSLCTASRDGGTNALVVSPPDAIQFHYGPDSARRHLAAARAQGLPSHALDLPAFAVDIDTPDDLVWLCMQATASHTADLLDRTGLRTRILQAAEARTA